MYVAKMTTRYPDYHGTGYYNFLMDEDADSLEAMVEEQSHDFMHQSTVFIDMSQADILKKYPTKQELDKGEF